jgi:hypothetical protein
MGLGLALAHGRAPLGVPSSLQELQGLLARDHGCSSLVKAGLTQAEAGIDVKTMEALMVLTGVFLC